MVSPKKVCAFFFCFFPCGLALVLALPAVEAAEQKPIWLAVVRPDLLEPLKPLANLRRRDGFDVVISTKNVGDALKEVSHRPEFLLLVGDDEPGKENASWYLPAKRMKLYRWRSVQQREYASDAAWGDLDKDGIPAISVGRIPARTRAEVELAVRKVVAFESQPPKPSDLNLPVWLGSPEYTAAINAVASGLGVSMLQTKGPSWLKPCFVCGNPNDPFCGWPPNQPLRFTRQVKQGGVLGVMMGHASAEAFFSMSFRGQPVWYTAEDARAEFSRGPPVPPLIFLTCESGNFTQATPCLAKSLLFFPGGPVATIGATTEPHPLTNYFSGACLLSALGGKERRLGALWLACQRQARKSHDFIMEMMLKDAEGSLDKEIDQGKLRRDQPLMYALLGDPATRLRLPEPLPATVQRTATGWQWRAKKPPGATSLEVGFRDLQFAPKTPKEKPSAETLDKAAEAANDCFTFRSETSACLARDRVEWNLRSCRFAEAGRADAPNTLYVAVLKLD